MTFQSVYLLCFQIYNSSKARGVTIWEFQILHPTHYFFPLFRFQIKGRTRLAASLSQLKG
jgi:hypothetical protein